MNNTWLINASAIIRNDGVAPFYYDLSLSVVIAGTAFNMISNSSLSQLLPNASAVLVYNNAEVNPPI